MAAAGARVKVDLPGIALTYDDGPDPHLTPMLLDVLGEGAISATFFLVGEEAERHPEIVQRMISEGHAVGSHSMRHPDFRRVGLRTVMSDVAESRESLDRVAGVPVRLFRPPHGRLTLLSALYLRARGYSTWLWNVDSYDWKADLTTDDIVGNVAAAEPGSVVLLHDTGPRTIEVTRRVIGLLSEQGTPLVTLRDRRRQSSP